MRWRLAVGFEFLGGDEEEGDEWEPDCNIATKNIYLYQREILKTDHKKNKKSQSYKYLNTTHNQYSLNEMVWDVVLLN